MPYVLEFSSRAAREFVKLAPETQRRLQPKMEALEANPRPAGCEKLSGVGAFRIRAGGFRIVYVVNDSDEIITVTTIGHRKDVYRRLD